MGRELTLHSTPWGMLSDRQLAIKFGLSKETMRERIRKHGIEKAIEMGANRLYQNRKQLWVLGKESKSVTEWWISSGANELMKIETFKRRLAKDGLEKVLAGIEEQKKYPIAPVVEVKTTNYRDLNALFQPKKKEETLGIKHLLKGG